MAANAKGQGVESDCERLVQQLEGYPYRRSLVGIWPI